MGWLASLFLCTKIVQDSVQILCTSLHFSIAINNNNFEAKRLVSDEAYKYPKDIFVLLASFDVFEKLSDMDGLTETFNSIEELHRNPKSKCNRDYLKCKAIYLAIKGDILNANQIVRELNISDTAKIY
ncbi:hypothetical protein AAF454_09640 [Kurthia gibsonii]|uniref:Uncharacterized protein n=1 Tax=Kurthia gibsonii TaxID=33946 RepID=A0ABU9LLU6_9BACL